MVVRIMRIIQIFLCLCVLSLADLFANKSEHPTDLILTHIVSATNGRPNKSRYIKSNQPKISPLRRCFGQVGGQSCPVLIV